jgi:1-acyl-sn-glycerol-3-phosphate acyltransferase
LSSFGLDFRAACARFHPSCHSDLPTIFNSYPPRPGLFSRLFPALTFYSKTLMVIVRAARDVRAGRRDLGLFVDNSLGEARAVNAVGARIIVENIDILRTLKGPCIIAGNHMSSLETMVLPGLIMPIMPMTFVAKKSLTKYPLFGTALMACDPIIVGRDNPREDLRIMTAGTHDRLSRGISVVVFPQTTRTKVFAPEHFNSIGAKLAKREGVPLVPLALKTDLWGNGRWMKDIGRIDPKLDVRFRFGEPIDAAADDREAHRKTVEFIEATLEEWHYSRAD